MAATSDGTGISEARLCEIVGVDRSTRRKWAKRELLRVRKTYEERDAVELCVLARLTAVLGPTDAPIVWVQIRDDLMSADDQNLDIVVDAQYKGAFLTTDLGSSAERLRHERPVRVLSLERQLREIREAFARLTTPAR
jgi:hypothetical protein